ncbi:hypothetical protein [Alkalilimnicola ehrlichii]|nr:hypothetical protein [Alkalilimnicola ehrlichii]
MDEWQKAKRQARRIGKSSRKAQSVLVWAALVKRAIAMESGKCGER